MEEKTFEELVAAEVVRMQESGEWQGGGLNAAYSQKIAEDRVKARVAAEETKKKG